MDEVLEKFEATLGTVCKDDEGPKSNFDNLYKNWGKLGNQEERRKEILEVQRADRNNKLDKFRGILKLMNAVETDIYSRPKSYYRPNIYVAGFNRVSPTYCNVLMLSEWMIEKPTDFDKNWFVVPCPKGVRMLVIAHQGTTKCFTKYGQFKFKVTTALPGGFRSHKRENKCCVLDCFYYEKLNTMYILDFLAWNSQPFTDGETEFRDYWLQTQLPDIPGLQSISVRNEVIFKLLPKISCDPESFQKFMMSYPPLEEPGPPIDGLLFYHKQAHYVSGQTPLVGWLYPYMVPEVLGQEIKIHEAYAAQKPEDYINQKEFIEIFEQKQIKGRGRSKTSSRNSSMDTSESTESSTTASVRNPRSRPQPPTKTSTGTETFDTEAIPFRPSGRSNIHTDGMESETTDTSLDKKEDEMESEVASRPQISGIVH